MCVPALLALPPPVAGGLVIPPVEWGGLMNRLYRGAPGSCLLHRSFWRGEDPGGGGAVGARGWNIYTTMCITYI